MRLSWDDIWNKPYISFLKAKAAWRTFYSDVNGQVTELSIGADNTVLKSTGATSAPEWAAPALSEMIGGNWKVVYTNGFGVYTEVPLGAALTALVSNGGTAAPTMQGVKVVQPANVADGQTAAVSSVVTYTPTAQGLFEINVTVTVTTATLHNFAVQVTYTDETSTSRTLTVPMAQLAGTLVAAITNVTGVGPYEGVVLTIRAKANTAITVLTAGTFSTVVYDVAACITQVA